MRDGKGHDFQVINLDFLFRVNNPDQIRIKFPQRGHCGFEGVLIDKKRDFITSEYHAKTGYMVTVFVCNEDSFEFIRTLVQIFQRTRQSFTGYSGINQHRTLIR